ncbi:hypothetical protein [Methylobacter psychrophilus]|uniref:hypothetical protein n=1 Tax=Methylobacter psychrophilus TaxID=96941 RepID=UPI0021D4CA68|nr:hypothetical protein [Methylobacter psychrophilus]
MILNTLASLATAIGVFIAAWQISESRKLAGTSFENQLNQEYRELVRHIPVDALIGKTIDDSKDTLRENIYNYLDLCNEQTYLRQKKRISKNRWKDWNDGIKENLSKPAFKEVWDEIKVAAPSAFTALARLEKSDFNIDPSTWS